MPGVAAGVSFSLFELSAWTSDFRLFLNSTRTIGFSVFLVELSLLTGIFRVLDASSFCGSTAHFALVDFFDFLVSECNLLRFGLFLVYPWELLISLHEFSLHELLLLSSPLDIRSDYGYWYIRLRWSNKFNGITRDQNYAESPLQLNPVRVEDQTKESFQRNHSTDQEQNEDRFPLNNFIYQEEIED